MERDHDIDGGRRSIETSDTTYLRATMRHTILGHHGLLSPEFALTIPFAYYLYKFYDGDVGVYDKSRREG